MSLLGLFKPPAPIDGTKVRRVVADASPMPQPRKLNPARAHRRAADRKRHEQRKALLRELTEKELDRVGGY